MAGGHALVRTDVVEQLGPAAVITPACAVTMGYRAIACNRYLRCLGVDVQRSQHPRVRVSHGPGEVLLHPVRFQLVDVFIRACADNVDCDLVFVVRTNLLIYAP